MAAERQAIRLSDHFTTGKLLRFTFPTMLTMIFSSFYGIVDGFFVSNYAGKIPFAALNLVMPFIMMLAAVGFMFGSGGSALVSMTLGMGNRKQANQIFSLVLYVMVGCGIVLAIFGYNVAPAVSRLLGSTDEMLPYCILYVRISMLSVASFMMQNFFQIFMITAERPKLGFAVTLSAGLTNIFLDWLFVGVLGYGLAGAAFATVISETIGGVVPLIYFLRPNTTELRLGKTVWNGKWIFKAATNGASEFFSNIATSIVGMLYNGQLLKYAGENGVAAYGVIMYVNFIFVGIFFGYSMGVSPIIGYQYGADNREELKGLFKRSVRLIAIAGVILTAAAELTAPLLAKIFVGYDRELFDMTVYGFRAYSLAFLTMGLNIFGSAFFTALNNGAISALLSLTRSFFLQIIFIFLLPAFFGPDGLWMVVVASDTLCVFLTIVLWRKNGERYHYLER